MCEDAAQLGARTIVVGNRRVQGIARVPGSIAGDVLKRARCDVLIANTIGARASSGAQPGDRSDGAEPGSVVSPHG